MPPFRKVAILGVGLLGGSVGLALRRAGFAGRIAGFGRRQASLDAARQAGAIDQGGLDLEPVLAEADLVILASPVGLFPELMTAAGPHLAGDAIVADVGSTKRQVVAWAGELLPKTVRFVGCHPVAGSDKRGVQYARADLFDGACCVITPRPAVLSTHRLAASVSERVGAATVTSRAGEYAEAVQSVDRFWRSLGMWTIRMTPALHDRYLALVSHLPHATAVALMLLDGPEAQDLAGPGFLDSTRVAGGDPELWRDIFLTNADRVVGAIKALNGKLARVASLIERGDGAGLTKLLADAQGRRQEVMERRLKRRQMEG